MAAKMFVRELAVKPDGSELVAKLLLGGRDRAGGEAAARRERALDKARRATIGRGESCWWQSRAGALLDGAAGWERAEKLDGGWRCWLGESGTAGWWRCWLEESGTAGWWLYWLGESWTAG